MELKVFIEKFADAIETESPESLVPETIFRDLEEWSSLSTLSVIALADEEFGVELSAADMKNTKTIQDLFNLLNK